MGKRIISASKEEETSKIGAIRPAFTPEARESQMISLAIDLAEQQLRDGTASAQVITHYLKLGTMREKVERDIMEKQRELMEAKTQQIKSQAKVEELYANALKAMKQYSGEESRTDEYEEE